MKTVLVVDDNKAVREVVMRYLESAGMDVAEASNAEDGLSSIRGRDFDLVITDFAMGGMSGVDLVDATRSLGKTTPFVLMTASQVTKEDTGNRFLTILRKPFRLAEIDEAMRATN